MRIALISDIHGNNIALMAVLEHIRHLGVDQIICLGDVATLGPAPSPVIQILREEEFPCILGNHDAFLFDRDLIHTYTKDPMIITAVDWCRRQLSHEDVAFLRTFQLRLEIALDAEATLVLFHGSPLSHMEDLLSTTPPTELDRLLAGHNATVLAGGHTHIQMLRQHRGMLLVNPGSVGMPFKEYVTGRTPTLLTHAEYAVVEASHGAITVSLCRVPLSRELLREAVARSGDHPLHDLLLQMYA